MSIVDKFTPPHPLNTAVLFLIFNRPDTTKRVFEAIRQAKPPKLYIAADGARKTKKSEHGIVEALKTYVLSNIDWECEIKTLFRNENLGCKYAVSGAIDWFFENEEMGIILEDDCLPSQSFFWYCEELLIKYKDNMSIYQINGVNFQNRKRGSSDYYFSMMNHVWGWASWSNRWKNYNVNLEQFDTTSFKECIPFKGGVNNYYNNIFVELRDNKIDTWDYQWLFETWRNGGLSITPNVNLISNIGFGEGATHTFDTENKQANQKIYEIQLNNHPQKIKVNSVADKYVVKNHLKIDSFYKKFKKNILKFTQIIRWKFIPYLRWKVFPKIKSKIQHYIYWVTKVTGTYRIAKFLQNKYFK
ncbi:nucleotide-diphospho-sugar transferase [Francisella philomiragia]|uniref:Nucleotide-diphospho-sugar transferase n=1 Tax=Francisella philomiragia TaxID=28110 RepID=A0AAW3DAN5_9GAMM|nr:nucleotide-diphospho-sugar transferase [Francisella philomiragia]KFJ42919.1 putative protein containing nucleotide-diphospho-sugar transferase domain protein [Francisella philomiragia]MBK2255599.1 nucleotide-diphospho-sugar transferase [Francisella philomiragia]MBK2273909.1 nucleotide-diphospho-sugar transferase [Francisella philomiragia]MBK2277754.1 nucleotide-diphospho-sugar transferase [Francisella philomiragia]MBK2281672.1 nucleotide-diphospho-sugar transferase [Francisella philomiragia